jgi:hypothetical protein
VITIRGNATGYDFVAGGGGTAPAVTLVKPANVGPFVLPAALGASQVVTFVAPTGGTPPYTYTAELRKLPVSGGATLSGSGLSWTVSNINPGESGLVILSATDSAGQVVRALGLVVVQSASNLVGDATAPSGFLTYTTTTTNLSVPAFTGGLAPLGYSAALVSSLGGSSTATIGAGSGVGPYTINGLQAGETILLQVTATDATGQQGRGVAVAAIEPAPSPDLVAGAAPAVQELGAGTTSTNITFNAFSGGVAPLGYSVSVSSGTSPVASVSGSFPTYTISGMVDGSGYQVTVVATDAVGQVATSTGIIEIGGSSPFVDLLPPTPTITAQTTTIDTAYFELGSYSETVASVTATISRDSGSDAAAVTISEPTPGVYAASVSGLTNGFTYNIVVTGTASDGRTAILTLAIARRSAVVAAYTFVSLDFSTITAPISFTADTSTNLTFGGGTYNFNILSGNTFTAAFSPGSPLVLTARGASGGTQLYFDFSALFASWPSGAEIAVEWVLLSGWTGVASGSTLAMGAANNNSVSPYVNSTGFSCEITRTATPADQRRARRTDGGTTVLTTPVTQPSLLNAFGIQLTLQSYQQVPTLYLNAGGTAFAAIGTGQALDPGRAALPQQNGAPPNLFQTASYPYFRWAPNLGTDTTLNIYGVRVGYR